MGSPDNNTVSSSPMSIRNHSPVRRRSSHDSTPEDIAARVRLSPTLIRSFDPNDPDVRERQRTMDVDMAMQLSRARRETISSSPFETRTPSIHHQQQQHSPERPVFPVALDEEEDGYHNDETNHLGGLDNEDSVDGDTLIPRRSRSDPSLQALNHPGHPSSQMMGNLIDMNAPGASAANFGLPTYQANASSSSFDFAQMEQFAAVEKANLGISTPVTRFAPPPIIHRPSSSRTNAGGPHHSLVDLGGEPSSSSNGGPRYSNEDQSRQQQHNLIDDTPSDQASIQRALRQRKVSQSNTPRPRPARKGFGGKISLFESAPTEPLPNLPPLLSSRPGNAFSSEGGNMEPYSDYGFGFGGGVHTPHRILTTAGQGHDRPYRFSFYSNALNATIHARSFSELPAEGQTFEDLFTGIAPPQAPPPTFQQAQAQQQQQQQTQTQAQSHQPPQGSASSSNLNGLMVKDRPTSSLAFSPPNPPTIPSSQSDNGTSTRRLIIPEKEGLAGNGNHGDTDINTWWLDVMCPTDEEMKMLSKVFSIHPLTTEDILMEETREKIELFRNYYLVCFRSFDQDPYSPTYLEPLNMYIIVFREGTLSFHFRPTPHPQNVRRRIKQLKDYISVTSDWISYALIDDITDAFGPLIQSIEYEVDSIDELVLILKEAEQSDMLRRIGTCRKKVMGLLRLMGNKADVVKGLAKRCNENWRVAPTSDIGLYLSDIQDHLITMTQNLNHYEKILSRSHSNYLAQISIEMTDANNQINDVLSKLTALGTVLIPMNLVTGLWGMNVHVPGEDIKASAVLCSSSPGADESIAS
ncbi:manganese resistance protein MNR2 [Coprinopsis cinerea okayama7|uniref:Manganese resistance protein MNR2 n=1 Tax=Coprinopsis cinerea (strain Okayama-7 / 130 / ATCC MYA-4618 / FGSC 9003) TaxID=240176 RepID=A8NYS6_COPC7|nr:manganese resistance protein MNR2 [Coprinopsis cinerea okayama7\|eukprot:XP_001837510.1 manganese resistance protein MNR2 [Coprinopsis cinerea okayama7\